MAAASGVVDDSGMPGLDKVDSLAEYLVELRNQTALYLNNQQVSTIVALWQNLPDHDRQRVVFAARHQSRLDTGRFRSPKKRQEFTPGTESVKRHALTTTAPLAQWPDCCRLIETIFVRLCAIHHSPRKKGTGTVSRWDLILLDYRKIRQLILCNGPVMQQTTLQLVDVSHTTLVQWHNKRVKRQENMVVMQGLNLPSRLSVAANPLPSANVRPSSAPPQPGPAHQYHLPSSTVGLAKLKRKVSPSVATPMAVNPQQQLLPAPPSGPQLRPQQQLFPAPPSGPQLRPQQQLLPAPPSGPQLRPQQQLFPAPPSGPQLRPQRQLFPAPPSPQFLMLVPVTPGAAPQTLGFSLSSAPPAPAPVPRKLTRKVLHNTCKKCGQFRTAETGHSQYKGVVYCPSVEAVPKEQWLEDMKRNK
ncbi:disheveled-associated activator of morphogenesis 1-A-like [Micropterus salmoides]|uniref:disheveled-associated activator of morphogenesis 1-A-like n=1 Tax=Micropterus salmoides TaxID=27706 RepID=UPI0018EC91C5|nr:disheveled-associated activator of morphogenesis 1-A-like [Micropterus salmoides]